MIATNLIGQQLRLLHVSGCHPYYQNSWAKVRASGIYIILVFILFELTAPVILKWNGLESMQPIGMSMLVLQVLHRTFTIITQRTKFIELIDCVQGFSYPNELENLNIMRIRMLSTYYKICRKYRNFVIYVLMIIIMITLFVIPTILQLNVAYLPLYHYKDESPNRQIISAMICLEGFYIVPFFVIPFEFLFVSFVIHLICEIRVLKSGLASLADDNPPPTENVRLMVTRHVSILKCIEKMNNIYSTVFLNQFFSSSTCLCGILISATVDDSSGLSRFAFSVTEIGISLGQLFIMCLGGTLLMEECASISSGAYECEWWNKTQPTLRKSLVLIIQRSERANMLVAAGLFPMNLESFAKVLKGAYTYYSLLHTMYKH